jgi:hypothetical protein
MPTVERWRGYRFNFYSHEPNEPPHVHVDARGCTAKFWLQPVSLVRDIGFNAKVLAEPLARPCSAAAGGVSGGMAWASWPLAPASACATCGSTTTR